MYYNQYTHPRNILVATLTRLYNYGMTTTSGGNLSIKDDDGNIWITPGGIDKGTLRPEDIVMVKPNGDIVGRHRPSCELPFHRSVYTLRKDVKAVLHAHSPALVAFSLTGRVPNTKLLPTIAEACGKVDFAPYEIPGSEKLGNIIAAKFAEGADSVIMENHGAVMAGENILQAFARFEALDYVARIEINAATLSDHTNDFISKIEYADWPFFKPRSISPRECELRDDMANFSSRAYRQRLLFSGSAFLSARIKGDDFLITPANFEIMNLAGSDVVRMKGGAAEAGKTPSAATAFCRKLYQKQDWINSIIMTRPPNAMSFAVTGTYMDSRTIPESYIMLRDLVMVKSEEYLCDPESVIAQISPANPVVIIENCGVLTCGKSILEAFDRLEVAEFTAKCILLASRIGKLNPISQQQVDDIITDFKLPLKQ